MKIEKPGLIVYAFAFKGSEDKPAGRYIGQLWEACTKPTELGGLGMNEPVQGINESRAESTLGFRTLESACVPAPDKDEVPFVAFRFAYNDVFGLIACLAPDEPKANWPGLYAQWHSAISNADPPDGLVSESCVFFGFHGAGDKPADMGREVAHALATNGGNSKSSSPACVMGKGIYLWERAPRNRRRTFAVLGSETRNGKTATATWLFWNTESQLATFAAYLLQSWKLNYESVIYSKEIHGLREQENKVDGLIDSVLRLHREIHDGGHVNADELIESQSRVARAQSDASGLLIRLSHLKELQQTVRIAEYNLRALILPARAARADEPHPFLRQDLERAQWLQRQIECDITYMEAVSSRALESYKATNLRLEQVRQANALRQHHLELTQTVVLGALLICLDAMHAFHTEVPFPAEFQWPVIVFLMALAFAIPPFLLHWRDGYGKLERLGATFVGASAAMIADEFWRKRLGGVGHLLLLRIILFSVPILLAWVALWLIDRPHRRHRRKL